jgi:hypothetical protein
MEFYFLMKEMIKNFTTAIRFVKESIQIKHFYRALTFGVLFIFFSCEEVIELDLNEASPRLVVEGWIHNQPGPYKIRLSLTTSYFDTAAPPAVENAMVIISENDSFTDTLNHQAKGIYVTRKILQGKAGATYRLIIMYQGKIYEAISTMKPVAAIDTLTYRYKESTLLNEAGYFVSIYFQEPPTQGDYYRWIFYRNNKVYRQHDEMYARDEFVNGNYIIFEFNRHIVQQGDTVRVEMWSVDKAAYDFFRALDEVDNSGDLFDTPPGNAKGNISQGAIGYFGASSIASKEIIIR